VFKTKFVDVDVDEGVVELGVEGVDGGSWAILQKLFDRGDVVVHDEGVDEAPHAIALVEASYHGFAEGPPAKLLGEGPPKKKVFWWRRCW
jgi:hypothetical protein